MVREVMDVADGNVLSRCGSSTPPALAGEVAEAHFARIHLALLYSFKFLSFSLTKQYTVDIYEPLAFSWLELF